MRFHIPDIGGKAVQIGVFLEERGEGIVSVVFFGALNENNIVKPVLLQTFGKASDGKVGVGARSIQ